MYLCLIFKPGSFLIFARRVGAVTNLAHHHALPLDAHPAGDAGIDGMVGVSGVSFSIGSPPAEKFCGSVGPSTHPRAQPSCNAGSWWWRA